MFTSSTRDSPAHVRRCRATSPSSWTATAAGRSSGCCRASPAIAAASRRCARPSARAIERGIEYLTLFAFSSENWRRPPDEVSILMELFLRALEQEVAKLHENGIRFKVVGDLSRFRPRASAS